MWRLADLAGTAVVPMNDVCFRVLLKGISTAAGEACGCQFVPKSVEVGFCEPPMFSEMPGSSATVVFKHAPADKRVSLVVPGDSLSVLAQAGSSVAGNLQQILFDKVRTGFNRFAHEILRRPESFEPNPTSSPDDSLKTEGSSVAIQFTIAHKETEFVVIVVIRKPDFAWLFEKADAGTAEEAKRFVDSKSARAILIVDDNHNVRSILTLFLSKDGFLVKEAESTEAAMKILETQKVDLIVLDVMLPTKSGFQFCTELKGNEQFREIPVIFCSAKSQREDVIRAAQSGGIDYIVKPFTKNTLLNKIKTHLK